MPLWVALGFYVITLWGVVVAVFPEWARNLSLTGRRNPAANWWTAEIWRMRLLGILIAAIGVLNGTLGLTGVL